MSTKFRILIPVIWGKQLQMVHRRTFVITVIQSQLKLLQQLPSGSGSRCFDTTVKLTVKFNNYSFGPFFSRHNIYNFSTLQNVNILRPG